MSSKVELEETILTMITDMKPNLSTERFINQSTPIKRSLSRASSNEDYNVSASKRPKREDMFYIGSPREVRRIRADLMDARNTILILEKRISHMHLIRKEMQIEYENERTLFKSQQEKDRKSIKDLETQLQSIRQREQRVKEEFDELKYKVKYNRQESDMQIQELESNVANLQDELQANSSEENNKVVQLKRKVSEYETIYKAAQEEIEAHKKFIEELNNKLNEKQELEGELEISKQALAKAQMSIKELQFSKESYQEFQQQSKTQQYKLLAYADMERENRRLKEETKNLKNDVYNKLLLEEEVYDLRNRLVNYKEQEKKLTELQVKLTQTEIYLEEFRTLARTVCETSNSDAALPRLLNVIVERLQQQEITLTAEKIQLQSQISTLTHDTKVAKDELEKCQKHIQEMQDSAKNQRNLIHRMQKKLQLVTGERDSYRKQLDSYERDLTICVTPASVANPGLAQAQSQQERIQNLEKMVEGYRDMVHKLESDLRDLEPNNDITPIKNEQMNRLQEEIDKLKNDNKLLRERKDQLEIQLEELVVGNDRIQGHIIHHTKNPLAEHLKEREQEKEVLKQEVEKLKRKVKKLEEGIETSKLGDVTIDHKDIQALKEQLKTSETHISRLKEFFKNSMQEFRNVIYMLLGYKIDRTSNTQYKLTSMYAENTDDFLCFHLNSKGTLELLENAFSVSLEEMIDLHLKHQKSIPVFLSAVTTDLFNNKTMTKTYAVDDDDEEEEEEEEEESDADEEN